MNQPDLEPYDGQWVAVRGDRVVASADDQEALQAHPKVRETDDMYPVGDPPSGFYMVNV
jgi:hypothetical protein